MDAAAGGSQLGGEITNFKRKRLGLDNDHEAVADYLTIYLDKQIFGIPVLQIQDVLLHAQKLLLQSLGILEGQKYNL